jgi:hypothetical protein
VESIEHGHLADEAVVQLMANAWSSIQPFEPGGVIQIECGSLRRIDELASSDWQITRVMNTLVVRFLEGGQK